MLKSLTFDFWDLKLSRERSEEFKQMPQFAFHLTALLSWKQQQLDIKAISFVLFSFLWHLNLREESVWMEK